MFDYQVSHSWLSCVCCLYQFLTSSSFDGNSNRNINRTDALDTACAPLRPAGARKKASALGGGHPALPRRVEKASLHSLVSEESAKLGARESLLLRLSESSRATPLTSLEAQSLKLLSG